MSDTKITINGQTYESPEAMPPDVRRTYEEAMRMLGPAVANAPRDARTDVLAGHVGPFHGSVVVNHVVTMNGRRQSGVEGLSPELRRMYEDAVRDPAAPVRRPDTNVHVSMEMDLPPEGRKGAQPVSDIESRIRGIPGTLAMVVVIALILWYVMSR
jgi:hypothetical protein